MRKDNNDIKVSVLCTVYNHEKYLECCLKSLTEQVTDFKYEIIVHDDCSTDNSKKIIEEFYKKYPDKIVPIYEEENQYSKGKSINKEFLIPLIKGKYFSICEGDDYWIDTKKLQKQFDFMEKNPEYTLCCHNAIKVDNSGKKIGKIQTVTNDKTLSCADFINGGGGFIATNSIFAPAYLAKSLPSYFDILTMDYTWQIYLSSKGKSYCFFDYMSAYRVGVENSWTERMTKNPQIYVEKLKKIKEMLINFDAFNEGKYHNQVYNKLNLTDLDIYLTLKDYKRLRNEPYRTLIKQKKLKERVKILIKSNIILKYNKKREEDNEK